MDTRLLGTAGRGLTAAAMLVAAVASCGGDGDGAPSGPEEPNRPTLSPRLLHTFAPSSLGFYYGPPTLLGNAIYVGTSRGINYQPAQNNAFYKLSLSLTRVWEFPLGSREVRGGAALDAAGNIYFVVEEGRFAGSSNPSTSSLYSLDPSGALRWTRVIRRVLPNVGMNNPAIATDYTIYVGGDKFYAFDAEGNEKWSYSTGGPALLVMNAPIIDPDGNIYFSSASSIYSLTPAGTRRWSVTTSGEYFASPAFSRDYSRIVVPVQDSVFCLQARDGARVWAFSPPGITGVFRATPAVDDSDHVYLGTKADTGSVFYALRADGSGLRWQKAIRGDLYSSPAIGNDRTLYLGSEGPVRLHALDLATGAEKWSSPLPADVTWNSPAISDGGTMYIGSMDIMGSGGGLYAFRTDATGLMRGAGSPRFHGGNANTGRREF